MKTCSLISIVCLAVSSSSDEPTPSFSREIRPLFVKYCLQCHNQKSAKGGFSLETVAALRKGGDSGPAIVPGDPDKSRLVRMLEGKDKRLMPPKRSKQPTAAEKALVRLWVAGGAKVDRDDSVTALPPIAPKKRLPSPITSLAYHPQGKWLAVGGYEQVQILDAKNGTVLWQVGGQTNAVTALAFSPDGKWLAVASGVAGESAVIQLYPATKPATAAKSLPGHKDLIQALAWHPKKPVLISAGYDRLIKIWDVASGKEKGTLTDHSDAVYGLAFSPDGSHFASASADRTVKVWNAEDGKRLYTLGESTDWLYTVAWRPNANEVAAAGVDQSIRVWRIGPNGPKLVHSTYAHEAPVTSLLYSPDGKSLYSLSEKGTAKKWDASRIMERQVYPTQREAVLAFAVRPDGKQLALGRFDGALLLLEAHSGKLQMQPLPAKPKAPVLKSMTPKSIRRGTVQRVVILGEHFDENIRFSLSLPNCRLSTRTIASSDRAEVDVQVPASAPAGIYLLTASNEAGTSNQLSVAVDLFEQISETEPNDTISQRQKVTVPVSLAGLLNRMGDIDYFGFSLKAGQEVGVQVVTSDAGQFDPVLRLTNEDGDVVATGNEGLLGYRSEQTGVYVLSIRDRQFRGGMKQSYRLHIGNIPIVTGIFPLGGQKGQKVEVQLRGVHLGRQSVLVPIPGDAPIGTMVPISFSTPFGPPLGKPQLVVGEFPEVVRGPIPVPGTANGVLIGCKKQTWRFHARKGERLIIETHSRRLGMPMDSFLEILDADGKPLPRATLRCLAKTYTTFRDHDSVQPSIRIEAWDDLAVNDYVYLNGELLRIRQLPRNPDDNCVFFSEGGRRRGELGTTPSHHSVNEPLYKVAIHPPGKTFPPNGLPVFTLYWRNDDGGLGYDKDSRLFFDPPEDGTYHVRVSDTRGQTGMLMAYRLTIRPPRPDFRIRFSPKNPTVWSGGAAPIDVIATRIDGFEGAIEVRLENVPPGFSAPVTHIPAGEESTSFALWADAGATFSPSSPPLAVVATATINGTEVVRRATGLRPKIASNPSIVTEVDQPEVVIQPGKSSHLTVTVHRSKDFTGRVPLDIKGLPHGVRVLNVGLNGILITPAETRRRIVLYAEPWVEETDHPFVVVARREDKRTQFAARSVLLKVRAKK
ncbi:MAG: hypothetical protein KatS3mg105_1680 [Gemmatales bacterium]|nr:MAG: hypothetical protein KatS3mg105_1680 [Gemmatales bacterium]